jgi:hypothetical protein
LALENEDIQFFREASSLIYDWLTKEEEDRVQLHTELYAEKIRNIEKLDPKKLFFRLIHYIQVKYIKVQEWANDVFKNLESIQSKVPDFSIEDLIFRDANEKDVSLRELQSELSKREPSAVFKSFLDQLELQEQFRHYLNSLQEREEWQEW